MTSAASIWSRVRPSLSTEIATLTFQVAVSRHHVHAQKIKMCPPCLAAAYSSASFWWTPCWLLESVRPEQSLQLEQLTRFCSSSSRNCQQDERNSILSGGNRAVTGWNAVSTSRHLREACTGITMLMGQMERAMGGGRSLSSQCSQCSCWSRYSPVAAVSRCAVREAQALLVALTSLLFMLLQLFSRLHPLPGRGERESVRRSFISVAFGRSGCRGQGSLQLLLFWQL